MGGGSDIKIGFIELGNMGAPMAANLHAAGYTVTGFDPAAPCPAGITQAADAASAAQGANVLITMLPDGAASRVVAAQVLTHLPKGASGWIVPRLMSPAPAILALMQQPITIEMAFSKLKAHLRRIGARTFDHMFDALS